MGSTPYSNETERIEWYKEQYKKTVEIFNKAIIPDEDFGALCTCAVRYCIGRETYMPGLIQAYLTPILDLIDNRALKIMRDDILTANYLGDEKIDKPGWMKFLAAIEAELEERKCL